jgi:hypothetical protein
MGDSSYRLNFDQGKKNEIQQHNYCRKGVLGWVKLQRLVAKCCEMKQV